MIQLGDLVPGIFTQPMTKGSLGIGTLRPFGKGKLSEAKILASLRLGAGLRREDPINAFGRDRVRGRDRVVLHRTPYTLHPTPYSPYTVHPTAYTLHPTPPK